MPRVVADDSLSSMHNYDPTTIALVRHGQTDWNTLGRFQGSSDTDLNHIGQRQAEDAATFLRAEFPDLTWDAVRHSPLRRAAVTGQIIARALGISTIATLPSLTERDFASGEGLTLAECGQRWPNVARLDGRSAHDLIPGVEPTDLVSERGVFAVGTLTDQYPGGHVVAAAHGTLLRLTLSRLLDAPFTFVPNGGVVVLQTWREDGVLRVRSIARSFQEGEADPTQTPPR